MKDGGPAFPTEEWYDEERIGQIPGMSLRDWFASRAPTEIPHWFEHIPAPKRGWIDVPQWLDADNAEDRAELRAWVFDRSYRSYDLPEHLQWFQQKFEDAVEAQSEYEKRDLRARYFQWRWYYADMMIEGREK